MRGTIEIATAADENYAMPLAAMLASVQMHLDAKLRARVHVLSVGISKESREKIDLSVNPDCVQLIWIDVDQAKLMPLRFTLRPEDHVSLASYARLLIPDLLSDDIHRVIYLDSDLICTDSIGRLWMMDMRGRAVAAVPESVTEGKTAGSVGGIRAYRELQLPADFPIFNSGVMVLDLCQWRELLLAQQAFAYLMVARDYVRWHDQEAINVVIRGNWHALSNRWNHSTFQSTSNGTAHSKMSAPPAVVHFNSETKPWHDSYDRELAEVFFNALDRTAWSGWRPAAQSLKWLNSIRNRGIKFVTKRRSELRRRRTLRRKKIEGTSVMSEVNRSWPAIESPSDPEIRAFCLIDMPRQDLAAHLSGLLADGVDRIFVAMLSRGYDIDIPVIHDQRIIVVGIGNDSEELATRKMLWNYGAGHWCLCTNTMESVCVPELDLRTVEQTCRYLDENGLDALSCRMTDSNADYSRKIRIHAVEKDTLTGELLSGPADTAASDELSARAIRYVSRMPLFRYERSMPIAVNQTIVGALNPATFSGQFRSVQGNQPNERPRQQ